MDESIFIHLAILAPQYTHATDLAERTAVTPTALCGKKSVLPIIEMTDTKKYTTH